MDENTIAVNSTDVIKQYKLESLNLQSPTIGADIIERFDSINQNFAKIIGSEYLKGAKGDSVVTKKVILSKQINSEGYEYYIKLIKAIVSNLPQSVQESFFKKDNPNEINEDFVGDRFKSLDGAELTLIYEVIEGVQNKEILTCLPFTYKDPWFGEITKEIDGENNTGANIDLSCIVCYDYVDGSQTKDFIKASLVPTIQYNEEDDRFNWVINGVETGIVAEGPQGMQGKTGTGIIVAEYEEVDGVHLVTGFHYHVDNNTLEDEESVSDEDGWIPVYDDYGKPSIIPSELQINLVNNCMIFARKKSTPADVTQSQATTGGDEDTPKMSTRDWIWGLLFVDRDEQGNPLYKIRKGGELSEILGLGTHTLLNLMELNRYSFVPYRDHYSKPNKNGESSIAGIPSTEGVEGKEGHVLYSSATPMGRLNVGAQRTLNIGPSQINKNVKNILNSEYDENYFNTIYIGVGEDLNSYVRLNPNAKEGHAYIFPTTKDKPISGYIQYANKLTEDAGTATKPIYFKGGVPVECNNKLGNDISGNADTATLAAEAKKLTVSAGSEVHPVYFKDGVPVKCKAIDTQADKALNAGRLTKKVSGQVSENDNDAYDVGSETQAIYFKDGVPVSCVQSLAHNITGTAAKADALTKNAGDSTHPVYFSGGIPKQCSGSLATNITGNAATASKLITNPNARSGPNLVGATTNPVYFKDGLPVQCGGDLSVNITGTAAQSKKLTSNAGSSTVPIYFKDGVPVACQSVSLNTTGNAATASRADRLKIDTVGSSSEPVYFKDGVPVKCTISSTAAAAKRLVVENVGTASKPVYFKAGVPVACDSLSINTTGNAATATKLATARKIDITGGIAATEQNFDGSSNINIPVTSINENYLTWGSGKQQVVGPMDMAIANYLNANRLSFMPAKNIKVYYSNNGGKTFTDYGLNEDQKVSLVTTGLGNTLYMGKKTNGTQIAGQDLLRVEITAENGNLYFSLKKIMLQISTNGAAGCYVIVEKKMNGSSTFSNVGKYAISGWSGWNAITCNSYMGGSSTSSINTMRLTFGFDSYTTNYNPSKNNVKFCIMKIAMHGENCWTNQNGKMAETGNLYSWDVNKKASFPSNLEAPIIDADKITCPFIDGEIIAAKNVRAESSGSILGNSNNPWNTAYIKNLKSAESADIDQANIETAIIKEAIIEKLKLTGDFGLGHVKIQDDFPSTPSNTSKNISYTVSNTPNWYPINSDVISKKSKSVNISSITLKTSTLPDAENNTIDVKIPKMIIPIAVTYMNDYDNVKEWKGPFKQVTNTYWAKIYLCDLKVTITCSGKTVTKTISNMDVPTHCVYDGNKRHLFIAYPAIPEFTINDIVLSKSGSKYKDITVSVKFDYSITRTNTPEGDATNSKVGYVYTPGVKLHNTTPASYTNQYEYSSTGQPTSTLPNKISSVSSHNGTVTGTYIPKTGESAIYLTKKGIRIVRGGSYVEFVAPQNNSKWEEDASGYVHMCIVGSNTKYHRKKRLSDILAGGTTWED